jgi:tetratricopeptide (TPR) repeat protein
MARNIKIILYVLFAGLAIWFAIGFYRSYTHATAKRPDTSTEAPAAKSASDPKAKTRMMSYGAGLFAVVVCFGLLIAFDFSQLFGQKFEEFVFDDEGEGHRDPEYEEAEKVWADGRHLEAIQLMRDYLKENPREQYVALRIAEIYEKDLHNHLAAALEYEEILKKNLPAERWGWAAVHLANLYSGKLNRPDDAAALLRRIVAEHPTTGAAKKARERLGEEALPEPPPSAPAATPPEKPSHLPPGFRPK